MQHKFVAQRCDVALAPASVDGPAITLSGNFTLNGDFESVGVVRFVPTLPIGGSAQGVEAVILQRGGVNDTPEVHVLANGPKRSELAAALLGDVVAGAVQVVFTTRLPISVATEGASVVEGAGVQISHSYRQG